MLTLYKCFDCATRKYVVTNEHVFHVTSRLLWCRKCLLYKTHVRKTELTEFVYALRKRFPYDLISLSSQDKCGFRHLWISGMKTDIKFSPEVERLLFENRNNYRKNALELVVKTLEKDYGKRSKVEESEASLPRDGGVLRSNESVDMVGEFRENVLSPSENLQARVSEQGEGVMKKFAGYAIKLKGFMFYSFSAYPGSRPKGASPTANQIFPTLLEAFQVITERTHPHDWEVVRAFETVKKSYKIVDLNSGEKFDFYGIGSQHYLLNPDGKWTARYESAALFKCQTEALEAWGKKKLGHLVGVKTDATKEYTYEVVS